MKIAVISDAHGNVFFLDQCLKMIENNHIDKIVALGDYFGYMRGGVEIVKKLVDNDAYLLKGNHEAMMLGELPLDSNKDEIYGLTEDRCNIHDKGIAFLRKLKERFMMETDGNKLLFVHGSPGNPINGYVYENDVDEKFAKIQSEYDFVFMGHTHRSFVKRVNGTTYINVGSCGLPRDYGLRPCFCIFDSTTKEVGIIRVNVKADIVEQAPYNSLHPAVREVFLRGSSYEN